MVRIWGLWENKRLPESGEKGQLLDFGKDKWVFRRTSGSSKFVIIYIGMNGFSISFRAIKSHQRRDMGRFYLHSFFWE